MFGPGTSVDISPRDEKNVRDLDLKYLKFYARVNTSYRQQRDSPNTRDNS